MQVSETYTQNDMLDVYIIAGHSGPMQATLSKWLIHVCSHELSLLPSVGREMSSSLSLTGNGVRAADCIAAEIVHCHTLSRALHGHL